MTTTQTAVRPKPEIPGAGPCPFDLPIMGDVATHPGLPGYGAAWMEVGPELAEQFLAYNHANRNQRPLHIAGHARDMDTGKWHVTGDTIKLNDKWELVDGQHRAEAIRGAGKPVFTLVVWGIKPQAQRVIDTNAVRKASDQLTMMKVPNATLVASVTRKWIGWSGGERVLIGHLKPTHEEILDMFEEQKEEILAAVAFGAAARQKARELQTITPTVWSLAVLIFSTQGGEDTARYFLDRIVTGAEIKLGDAEYAFRKRVMSAKADGESLSDRQQLYLLITAWNHFRAGNQVSKISLPRGGVTQANFPGVY